jgi:protein-S-isoprenylcysteine O-methyltransferase Ste14
MRATTFEFRFRVWIITGLIWAAFACSAFDHSRMIGAFTRLFGGPGAWAAEGFAIACVSGAAWIRTWAAAYLEPEVIHDKRLHSDRLVADGPFRHVRNPLYLGTLLLGVGFGLLASRTGFVVLNAGLLVFTTRLILREESELAQTQGGPYREYLERVPRWWPSLPPLVPAGGMTPRWPAAIRGEMMFWLFLAAFILRLACAPFLTAGRQNDLFVTVICVAFVARLLDRARKPTT